MSKLIYTRHQISIDPMRLKKFYNLGDVAITELRNIFKQNKASDVNVSTATGIIGLSLFGGSANPDRILKIEDEVGALLDASVEASREEELEAIARWALSLLSGLPSMLASPVSYGLFLSANDYLHRDPGSSFIRAHRDQAPEG